MAQSIGYIVASTGPLFLGTISEMTGGWTVPFIILMAVAYVLPSLGQLQVKIKRFHLNQQKKQQQNKMRPESFSGLILFIYWQRRNNLLHIIR